MEEKEKEHAAALAQRPVGMCSAEYSMARKCQRGGMHSGGATQQCLGGAPEREVAR